MLKLSLIVVAFFVVGGGLYMAYNNPSSLPSQLQPIAPIVKTGVDGVGAALSNTKNAQPAVMGVKSESTRLFQEDTSEKPVHQKAMEFTQYQYCKLVVKNYEDQDSNTSHSPTLSPSPDKN